MKHGWPYLIPFIAPIVCVLGFEAGGLYQYSLYFYLAIILPLADVVLRKLGVTQLAPAPSSLEWERSGLLRYSLYAFGLAYWLVIIWGVERMGRTDGGFFEWLLLTWFIGLVGSIAITSGHELIHKRNKVDRWAGLLTMLGLSYMFFETEHIYGHHAKPGTEEDPTSARAGEGFYAFLWRSSIGIVKTVAEIDRKHRKRRQISFFDLRNESLWFLLLPIFCGFGAYALGGLKGALLFYSQGFMSYVFLEAVSYLQHYGLSRAKLANGQYERVGPEHSWHADFPATNYLSFDLHKHADHHADARKPFYELSANPSGPKMPFGYPLMISLAFFPPLYRMVADRQISAFQSSRQLKQVG